VPASVNYRQSRGARIFERSTFGPGSVTLGRMSRGRSHGLVSLVLLAACTAPPPAPAAALEEPPAAVVVPEAVAPEVPAVTEVVVAVEELPADAPLPKEFPDRAERRVGKRFRDALGEHTLQIAEVRTSRADRGTTSTLYAQDRLAEGETTRTLWQLREGGDACRWRDTHGLLGEVTITDRDRDGVVEVGISTAPDCLTHARGARVVHRGYAGEARCQLVGWATTAGLVRSQTWKADATECAPLLVALADETLAGRAAAHAATATAGLPDALPDDLVAPPQAVKIEARQIDRTRGGVKMTIDWPKIRFEPTIDALELERELGDFLGVDTRYGRDEIGDHDASCTVRTATSQLLSVTCDRLAGVLTRAEVRQGIGGAPAGPSRAHWNLWLLPGLPRVDPLELIGDPALAGACQPLLAEGRYTLDRGGLIWEMAPLEGGSPDESCMEDDVLAWEAMKPRTARARQAIAEIVGAEAE